MVFCRQVLRHGQEDLKKHWDPAKRISRIVTLVSQDRKASQDQHHGRTIIQALIRAILGALRDDPVCESPQTPLVAAEGEAACGLVEISGAPRSVTAQPQIFDLLLEGQLLVIPLRQEGEGEGEE